MNEIESLELNERVALKATEAEIVIEVPIDIAVPPQPITTATPEDYDGPDLIWISAKRIYVSYFFAAWGVRMWEFAAIVFIMESLFPSSLMASSIFGMFEALSGIFGSSIAGGLIDTRDRLTAIQISMMVQNSSVAAAMTILFFVMMAGGPQLPFAVRVGALAILVCFGVTAKFGSMLDKMCVTKDWLVVLAKGDRSVQSQLNASVRRIDLSCQIMAPMAVGLSAAHLGPMTTCVLVGCWSTASFFLEIQLSRSVYNAIPALAVPKNPKPLPTNDCSSSQQEPPTRIFEHQKRHFATILDNFKAYVSHQCFWVSLPFAMLYMSVLSFGGIMVSYLKTIGCSDDLLALGRGLAALVAIIPTFIVPYLIPKKGLYTTGLIMGWCQVLCLCPLILGYILGYHKQFEETNALGGQGAGSQLLQNQPSSNDENNPKIPVMFVILVFISICTSRFGLWGFDLSETQMMQELVDKTETGKINGSQELLVNTFWLFSFVLTMIFSDPALFMWPAIASFTMVLGSATFYSLFGMKIEAAQREALQ